MSEENIGKLFTRLGRCHEVAALGGRVVPGLRYGFMLARGGRPLGLWSVRHGEFLFREFANYEPLMTAENVKDAHQRTVRLLVECQNGWAERGGWGGSMARSA